MALTPESTEGARSSSQTELVFRAQEAEGHPVPGEQGSCVQLGMQLTPPVTYLHSLAKGITWKTNTFSNNFSP